MLSGGARVPHHRPPSSPRPRNAKSTKTPVRDHSNSDLRELRDIYEQYSDAVDELPGLVQRVVDRVASLVFNNTERLQQQQQRGPRQSAAAAAAGVPPLRVISEVRIILLDVGMRVTVKSMCVLYFGVFV